MAELLGASRYFSAETKKNMNTALGAGFRPPPSQVLILYYIYNYIYTYRVWIKMASRPCMSSRVLTASFPRTKVVVEIRI